MGNIVARRRRNRARSQNQARSHSQARSQSQRNMSSSEEDSNTGNQRDESNDGEPDLASILSFLLRSGQVRLIRAGGGGAFEVRFDRSSNVDNEFEMSDDDFWNPPIRSRSPPLPRGAPDTSNIQESSINEDLHLSGGHYQKKPINLLKRLQQRESNCLPKRGHFTASDEVNVSGNFLPNSCETVAKFRSKAFCGTFSSDGNVFMSACQDQHIRLYDTCDGRFKLFRDIVAKDFGWSIVDTAYSPDRSYIIYSSWSEYIHLCNVYGNHDTHLALDLRPHDARFCAFSVSFSQDSKEIIAGGSDRCLYIYDRGSENRILRIDAHDDDVNAVCFADGSSKILISGGDDGICKVWDRRTLSEDSPKPVGMFAGHTDGITYVHPKGDGVHYLSNSKDQSIKLWDTRRFSSESTIQEARRIVANQNWDYRWQRIPRRSQRFLTISGNDALMTYRGHSVLHTLVRAKFSPVHTTGQKYIFAGCATGSVVIYDVLNGKIVTKLKDHHKLCVRDVSWHPYENIIMSSSWDCTLGKWEYNSTGKDDFVCDVDACDVSHRQMKRRSKRRRNDSLET